VYGKFDEEAAEIRFASFKLLEIVYATGKQLV
jgi:hypothetical protein